MHTNSPGKAVALIENRNRVFVHGGMMTPRALLQALTDRHAELKDVELVHIHTTGNALYSNPKYSNSFCTNNLFTGANTRKTLKQGNGSYTPTNLSMIPRLFRDGHLPLNVALIKVSPPNKFGRYSLGLSADCAYQAVLSAKVVVAQVDEYVPFTHGVTLCEDDIDVFLHCNEGFEFSEPAQPTPEQEAIGELVAGEIKDGSTIQLGIGGTSFVVAKHLKNKRGLKVWSEMVSDPVADLLACGAVDKVVTSFAEGGPKTVEMASSLRVRFVPCDMTNDFAKISKIPKFISINNVVEADHYGNTCCDSINGQLYSGIGGQMDFAHAAMYSHEGKGFLCLPSKTKYGKNRIVEKLTGNATVPAHLADHIVTENGIAKLRGKDLDERKYDMLRIAGMFAQAAYA